MAMLPPHTALPERQGSTLALCGTAAPPSPHTRIGAPTDAHFHPDRSLRAENAVRRLTSRPDSYTESHVRVPHGSRRVCDEWISSPEKRRSAPIATVTLPRLKIVAPRPGEAAPSQVLPRRRRWPRGGGAALGPELDHERTPRCPWCEEATIEDQVAISHGQRNNLASFSDGFIQPRVCRGRSLSTCATRFRCRWLWTDKSLPRGKY